MTDTEKIIAELKDKQDNIYTVQISPAIRVSIGEYFGMPAGTNAVKNLISALRKIGFDYVFDTNLGADLTVIEEGLELAKRLKEGKPLPMFTTCCPVWYSFVERLYPSLIPHLSTVKSPQAILGSLIKTFFSATRYIDKQKIKQIVIAPCVVKKEEAKDTDYWVHIDENIPNIDLVLTTKEIVDVFKAFNIDFSDTTNGEFDNPFGEASGGGAIFGTTGGVMESVLRTANFIITGSELEDYELIDVRNTGKYQIGEFKIGERTIKVAAFNDMKEIKPFLDKLIETGKSEFDFIEVMNCPGGCIGGIGQMTTDYQVLEKRREALFNYDKEHKYRAAHLNPNVQEIYKTYFGEWGSEKAKEILHARRQDKSARPNDAMTEEFGIN